MPDGRDASLIGRFDELYRVIGCWFAIILRVPYEHFKKGNLVMELRPSACLSVIYSSYFSPKFRSGNSKINIVAGGISRQYRKNNTMSHYIPCGLDISVHLPTPFMSLNISIRMYYLFLIKLRN